MERVQRWFRETFVDRTTREEFKVKLNRTIAMHKEQEQKQMRELKQQENVLRKIPDSPAEQARRMREWKKYKQIQAGLARRSAAIQRYEDVLHQFNSYEEIAHEAEMAQALPRMMEKLNLPDIRTLERDMESMQRLATDSQEVSSLIHENIQMSALSVANSDPMGDTMAFMDPTQMEDELANFLASCEAADPTPQKLSASGLYDTHTTSSVDQRLPTMPRVPAKKTEMALSQTLSAIGW